MASHIQYISTWHTLLDALDSNYFYCLHSFSLFYWKFCLRDAIVLCRVNWLGASMYTVYYCWNVSIWRQQRFNVYSSQWPTLLFNLWIFRSIFISFQFITGTGDDCRQFLLFQFVSCSPTNFAVLSFRFVCLCSACNQFLITVKPLWAIEIGYCCNNGVIFIKMLLILFEDVHSYRYRLS